MPLLAGIDIGTNTVRLLIAEVSLPEVFREVFALQRIPRLGKGISRSGVLTPGAMDRTIAVLKDFCKIIERYNVDGIAVTATSAVREAKNGREFIRGVMKETGLDANVISGEEEARLTYLGVRLGLKDPIEDHLVIDIGGGSTEFIIGEKGEVKNAISTNLGVVRLTEMSIKEDPPEESELLGLEKFLRGEIGGIKKALFRKDILRDLSELEGFRFIGAAGTITTLAAIDQDLTEYNHDRVQNYILKRTSVERIFDRLKLMTNAERAKIPALEAGREDVIVAGAMMVLLTMEVFGFEEMTVSDYGLREGIVTDLFFKRGVLREK